jgi:hypothetical protein
VEIAVWMLAATAVVCGLCELARRMPPRLAAALFLLAPLLLLPLWLQQDQAVLFSFVKALSVGIAAAFVCLLRGSRAQRPWALVAGYLILFVNIVEAMLTEAAGGGILNVLAGAILLATLALPRFISVRSEPAGGAAARALIYELGTPWVIGYTLWNFTFVYAAMGRLGLGTIPFGCGSFGTTQETEGGRTDRALRAV